MWRNQSKDDLITSLSSTQQSNTTWSMPPNTYKNQDNYRMKSKNSTLALQVQAFVQKVLKTKISPSEACQKGELH